MCGIFASEIQTEVSATLPLMKHRGPDEQVTLSMGGFTVGFARLAIVDVEHPEAEQPAVSTKGRIVAFNGEIYNYLSLDMQARSEIDVLARMLDDGLDPRQFIDGEYAILYYCPSQRRVALYRDRFGICPLYYQTHPHVAVSSERRRLKNPVEVPAHGCVVIDLDSRERVFEYAIPHYGVVVERMHPNTELALFSSLFEHAVQTRAEHSDVGFSTVISGGLDSSAIAYVLDMLDLRPQLALCVTLSEDSGDAQHARMVAEQCAIDLKTVVVSRDELFEDAPYIIEHLDMSSLDAVTALKWRASVRNWFAAKHCPTRVLLCGEGSDELFEGYPPHTAQQPMYRVAKRQLTAVRSLPAINLDRTNKLGLAHSIEYRAPFLASTLSYWLLSQQPRPPKQLLREYLSAHCVAPDSLLNRPKWGQDEVALDATWEEIKCHLQRK